MAIALEFLTFVPAVKNIGFDNNILHNVVPGKLIMLEDKTLTGEIEYNMYNVEPKSVKNSMFVPQTNCVIDLQDLHVVSIGISSFLD